MMKATAGSAIADKSAKRPMIAVGAVFLLCAAARIAEYFWVRTDETFLAENFLHKVWGIILMFIMLRAAGTAWKDIGFGAERWLKNIGKGLMLGTACFTIAYGAECAVLYVMNHNVQLEFFVSGFALNGETARHTGALFVLMCVGFNIINVWMEEGVFRGLFDRMMRGETYLRRVLVIALLFGVWHLVMPLRDYLEGRTSIANLIVMGIGYIILAGVMSVKWSLLYRLTGSLWMGLGDHLFNNVVVTNLIHVVSNNEADQMQIVRIMIGQLLSFAIVTEYYRAKMKAGK